MVFQVFSDSISQRLAPFDTKKMKPFTPAFLSGFYADVADVDEEIYRKSATDFVKEQLSSYLREDKTMRSYHAFNDVDKLKRHMNIVEQQEEAAMFPVWFMSYRKGNRVAYATVNGQTGKVVADLPVDPVKYVIGSAILTFFLFLLLNTFVFLRPISLLLLICLISVFTIWLYGRELRQIRQKDEALDDAGLLTNTEKENLRLDMQKMSPYGNVIFYSVNSNLSSAAECAASFYHSKYGYEDGTLFLVDMDNREICLWTV